MTTTTTSNPLPADATADIPGYCLGLGVAARKAGLALAAVPGRVRDAALHHIADALLASKTTLQQANAKDLEAGRANNLAPAMLDRLELTDERIHTMAEGVRQIATLPDPIGEVTDMNFRPSGIQVGRMRVPLGVIGIIYESRPNVTADAAGLCVKSGNAVILRGGSESFHSSQAIHRCMSEGLERAGLPADSVQMIPTTDRAAVGYLLSSMGEWLDVVVPRGGKNLIKRVQDEARVPVIGHLEGLCHVYVHEAADPAKARDVVVNAKTRRTGISRSSSTRSPGRHSRRRTA